jgi:acyl-CoA oxidase
VSLLSLSVCVLAAELGHGSNLRGLETVARFDAASDSWLLNTPSLQSTKWWSTGMPASTHCVLAAQLETGGQRHGLHFFMVQLRGEDLVPVPGVRMGDIGSLAGENSTPIGWLQLKDVRVPRRALLERRQHVTWLGEYVMGAPRGSMRPSGSGSGAQDKKLDAKTRQTLAYLTMLKTRVALASGAAGALSKACVIAARYSCVRQQGFVGEGEAREAQVIDYSVQRFRVLKWTATAYAFRQATAWMDARQRQAADSQGNVDLSDLPEVHASACGLKALSCVVAADGIEDLRRACGGHGFLNSAGLAPIEAGFKGPHTTGEGDYVLLSLQTARFLVKSLAAARRGEPLSGLASCLAPLRNSEFRPEQARPAPARDAEALREPAFLLRLFEARTVRAVVRAGKLLEDDLRAGKAQDAAWNANALALYHAAQCHTRYFILSKFVEQAVTVQDAPCRAALLRLVALYALVDLVEGQGWAGVLTAHEADLCDEAIQHLSAALRPDVIALVDAFDLTDRSLNSAIGGKDGKVYEALMHAAETSRLNVNKDGSPVLVPTFMDSLKPFIDTAFLRLNDGMQAQPAPSGSPERGSPAPARSVQSSKL